MDWETASEENGSVVLFALSLLQRLTASVRLADLLDMAVIAVFVYFAWSWVRHRASRGGLVAVGLAALLYIIARLVNMYLTLLLFQAGFTILVLALVLVFQEDLRRFFSRIATLGFSGRNASAADGVADVLTEVLGKFAEERIGALVALKGREPVEPHVDGGTAIDGRVSTVLLCSIFQPASPGHDGAVLIDGDRVEKLGVRLPLSRNLAELRQTGTRHAAALGLAERTDALVLVVSEERGAISIAQRGQLLPVKSTADLKGKLFEYERRRRPAAGPEGWHHVFWKHPGAKLGSLALAVALWLVFVYQLQTVQRTYVVPVEYRNIPDNLVIEDPTPAQVRVTLSGPEGIFGLFDRNTAAVSLDMREVRAGRQEMVISDENLNRPPALFVDQIHPRTVWFNAQQLVAAEIPVKIQFEGRLPNNLALVDAAVEPSRVSVLVPSSPQPLIHQIRTEPIELDGVTTTVSRSANLVLPSSARFIGSRPPKVRVTIKVSGNPSRP